MQFCEIILKRVFLLLDQLEFLLYFESTVGIIAIGCKSLLKFRVCSVIAVLTDLLLAYMAINIDFDDNKQYVFLKQRFMIYAFMIRK